MVIKDDVFEQQKIDRGQRSVDRQSESSNMDDQVLCQVDRGEMQVHGLDTPGFNSIIEPGVENLGIVRPNNSDNQI